MPTELSAALTSGDNHKVNVELNFRKCLFMVVSQCCDVADPFVLVCNIAPIRRLRLHELAEEQKSAFLANEVSSSKGNMLDETVDVVYPGFFHLASHNGLFDESHVAEFAAMRTFKQAEFSLMTKLAELKPEARHFLRRKLAVFFGRPPAEDLEWLAAPSEA
ncbi:MAG: hypothetical protein H6707_03900 [Deltaproteobacteria bacterium]|nr:hypothetical protein [Deltaproteobacteria bacterium]